MISPFQMLWSLRRKFWEFVMSIRMVIAHATVTKTIEIVIDLHYCRKTLRYPGILLLRGSTLRNTLNKGSPCSVPSMEKPRSTVGRLPFKGSGDSSNSIIQNNDHKQSPIFLLNKISEVTIEDHLRFTNTSYVKDSIKVSKGSHWSRWMGLFKCRPDVTDPALAVTIEIEDSQSLLYRSGDITWKRPISVDLWCSLKFWAVGGNFLKTCYPLKESGLKRSCDKHNRCPIAGGSGVGYVFTIRPQGKW